MGNIYFNPGDNVRLKDNIDGAPTEMKVERKVNTALLNDDKEYKGNSSFLGVKCFWFDKNGRVDSYRFNTKDLEHID